MRKFGVSSAKVEVLIIGLRLDPARLIFFGGLRTQLFSTLILGSFGTGSSTFFLRSAPTFFLGGGGGISVSSGASTSIVATSLPLICLLSRMAEVCIVSFRMC